MEGRMEGKRG